MSGRHDSHKGSSRSTRDDSRLHKNAHKDEYERRRSRSRSPRRRGPSPRSSSHSASRPRGSDTKEKDRKDYKDKKDKKKSSNDWESSEEEVPAPPPPPRITKVSMGFSKPNAPIKMNIGGLAKPKAFPAKPLVASVFGADDDDDDEPEEMPAEARMRMRNIGRETPTSAGPNSFGKTKQGFCDAKKVFEKNLKNALETDDKPALPKFPQTIYKIKGP